MDDTGSGSWPTPCAEPASGTVDAYLARKQRLSDAGSSIGVALTDLQIVAKLSIWPTPTVKDGNSAARHGYMDDGRPRSATLPLRETVTGHAGTTLTDAARLATWVSPSSRDWKDSPGMSTTGTNRDGSTRKRVDQLPRQVLLVHGTTSPGFTAATASGGQLNPAHSRWLMGYPRAWDVCADTATQSCRKSRRR